MESGIASDVSLSDLFEQFVEASTMKNILSIHSKILDFADLRPCEFNVFFPKFKRAVTSSRQKRNWKAKALFSKIEKRSAHKCYSNTKAPTPPSDKTCDTDTNQENCSDDTLASRTNNHALQNYSCLVIGSGPAGLRTAIELQLLGASRVVIVEKRGRFSRNNVLHLWPFVIDDLKSLGAKKFYGKFCAGSIDHISIRQLQLMLLKVCLMIGCDFRDSCSYMGLCPISIKEKNQDPHSVDTNSVDCNISDSQSCNQTNYDSEKSTPVNQTQSTPETEPDKSPNNQTNTSESPLNSSESKISNHYARNINLKGARAHFQSDIKSREQELHAFEWDIIIGADGRRNTLGNFFPRREFRGRLAIAITANFINRQTPAETSVPEISGISYIYNQDMFNALAYDTSIELENICYYKDDTHYFVMTAKKRSLLERGVLINDYAATQDLLADSNVNKEALLKYAKDAAFWTTGLEPLDFALNHYGQEDCAMFDFTSMYAASNACKALRTKQGGLTLVGLVGDSLLEPFWPTGSGCARGFLSSFDAAWMCRQWAVNKCAVIDFHSSTASRSSRNRNNSLIGGEKAATEPTTHDKMALSVIAERESIYRILAQTTSENLQQNYSHWTLNPHTRYPNLNRHLISPGQVEHLVAISQRDNLYDKKTLSPNSNSQRIKSPNHSKSRRSPKKLKSAGASPLSQPKNSRNRIKSGSRQALKSRSRYDISMDDDDLDFEASYKNLADTDKGGMTQYLNYHQRNSVDLDDLFIPSLSGTLPSSNNLTKLEAKKARDIDECVRQRRQRTKITIVRDQLISQMRGERAKDQKSSPIFSNGNAALFNEIRRMRESQSRGLRADSKPRDIPDGPLSLLNSMRRCASFAERVKSFESKLGNPHSDSADSTVSTPKTPIDNVKNLPQFATLQEIIINNTTNTADQAKKSRIPIAKLSKDDWNVKCWEMRLTAHKQRGLSVSSKSLNKAVSVDSGQDRFSKPKKQVDVFQGRIKEMADKLKSNKENSQSAFKHPSTANNTAVGRGPSNGNSVRSQGWVNHLKRELARGSDYSKRSSNEQPMNPALPNKPIKKLFEDEEDDDGIDVNKHYDHLCVNRPINKYLSKGSYTSHLARSKFNSATSKVINRPNPTPESKKAYLAALTSRGSSASSTLSDHSTNTAQSSSDSSAKQSSPRASIVDVECSRCKKFVSSIDRITLGTSTLHRVCLTCASCGLTLRTDEVQHHLNYISAKSNPTNQEVRFLCAICSPDMRADMTREADDKLGAAMNDSEQEKVEHRQEKSHQQRHFQSREDFLNSRIDYSEIYKNILNNGTSESGTQKTGQNSAGETIEHEEEDELRCEPSEPTEQTSDVLGQTSPSPSSSQQARSKVSPSPVQVTIPMKLVTDCEIFESKGDDADFKLSDENTAFSVASSETVNGSEQVTLILPSDTPISSSVLNDDARCSETGTTGSRRVSKESEMIDEEELQRILHLDNHKTGRKSSSGSSATNNSTDEDEALSRQDKDENDSTSGSSHSYGGQGRASARRSIIGTTEQQQQSKISAQAGNQDNSNSTSDDDSSSLDFPPDSDDYDDDDDDDDGENVDMNSTCEDFITSEEFDASSDKDEEITLSEASHYNDATRGDSAEGSSSAIDEHCKAKQTN